MKGLLTFISAVVVSPLYAQQATVVKLQDLLNVLNRKSDTTYVLNFWATWCKPCIRELPSFDSLFTETRNQKIRILHISLDNADELEIKVNPFILSRKLKPEVWLLDEADYNRWIDKVEPAWGGAIPVTLILNHSSGKRKFIEGETRLAALKKAIAQVHTQKH